VRGIDLSVDEDASRWCSGERRRKTSTLRAICGQLRQSQGHVRWADSDISTWPSFKVARAAVLVPRQAGLRAAERLRELLLGVHDKSKADAPSS